jgi:hypothetical protein
MHDCYQLWASGGAGLLCWFEGTLIHHYVAAQYIFRILKIFKPWGHYVKHLHRTCGCHAGHVGPGGGGPQ